MKAIETIYKGYRFRSRLEARWAVFFDKMGIKFEYEKEGYEKGDYRYLPDFYLPQYGMHVEVKGVMDERSAVTLANMIDFGSPIPFVDYSENAKCKNEAIEAGASPYIFCPGILLLGDIPLLNHGFVIHKLLQHNKGIRVNYFSFNRFYRERIFTDCELSLINSFSGHEFDMECYTFDCYSSSTESLIKAFEPVSFPCETKLARLETAKAYTAARQARFEFGKNESVL